ncbi:8-oxo-dGTP pyrophosphatase MutT (NUDIX family) [Pseudoclavibacter chungangensis]|uniref:NUDIX domain-containing protein n=1 Tax=Pseudoclavibacter chungangensis TaxID=587635 RepID=UPI0015CD08DE|nr:NUDIX hydrolase [Pseudoclavibacter chungangensis]NYJ65606.1 8-oxo-dGTP pyrophosphatase MutT (NUDIX family) [Pseudoclavibacter chungangensis]
MTADDLLDPANDRARAHAPGRVDHDRLGVRTGAIPVFTEHGPGAPDAFDDEVPARVRDAPKEPGDEWAIGPDGTRSWGAHGAAGVLVADVERGVLLQHRARWNHHGGTWGIPGGALRPGEPPVDGALREAFEEAGIPADALDAVATRVVDLGYWRYTTLVARARRHIPARVLDAESAGMAWVPPRELDRLRLHPGFAAAWPTLQRLIGTRPALVVDAANVVGARPDGWWRDRAGAATRLVSTLCGAIGRGFPAAPFGIDAELLWPEIVVVLEGQAKSAADPSTDASLEHLEIVRAPGEGDDDIVAQVERLRALDAERPILVVTSDRGLRERVEAAGALPCLGSKAFRTLLDGPHEPAARTSAGPVTTEGPVPTEG